VKSVGPTGHAHRPKGKVSIDPRRGSAKAAAVDFYERLKEEGALARSNAIELAQPTPSRREEEDKSLLQAIEARAKGPIVPLERAPLLYRELGALFNRLYPEMDRAGKSVPIIDLRIVDSPHEELFFIDSHPDERSPFLRGAVVFTTAVLERIFARSEGPGAAAGFLAALGVTQHEMAHAAQDASDRRNSAKAIENELDADGKGTLFSFRAGLPVEGGIRALAALDTGKKTDLVDSVFDSHPPSALRASAHRLLITLLRYEHGALRDLKLVEPDLTREAVLAEIRGIDLARFSFPAPRTPSQALDRLEEALHDADNERKELRFNFLLRWTMGAWARGELSDAETTRLVDLVERSCGEVSWWSHAEGKKQLAQMSRSFPDWKRATDAPHRELQRAYRTLGAHLAPRLRDPRNWAEIFRTLRADPGRTDELLGDYFPRKARLDALLGLARLIPPSLFRKHLGDELATRYLGSDDGLYDRDQESLETRSAAALQQFALSGDDPVLAFGAYVASQPPEGVPDQRSTYRRWCLGREDSDKELRSIFQRVCAAVWRQRGALGVEELRSGKFQIDWLEVAEAAAASGLIDPVDPRAVPTQMRQAAMAYLQGDERHPDGSDVAMHFARHARTYWGTIPGPKNNSRDIATKKRLQWAEPSMYPAVVAAADRAAAEAERIAKKGSVSKPYFRGPVVNRLFEPGNEYRLGHYFVRTVAEVFAARRGSSSEPLFERWKDAVAIFHRESGLGPHDVHVPPSEVLRAIQSLRLEPDEERALLSHVFLECHALPDDRGMSGRQADEALREHQFALGSHEWLSASLTEIEPVLDALIQSGLVSSAADLLLETTTTEDNRPITEGIGAAFLRYRRLQTLAPVFLREVEALARLPEPSRKRELLAYALVVGAALKQKSSEPVSPSTEELTRVLFAAFSEYHRAADLSGEEARQVFESLTNARGSRHSDAFFKEVLLEGHGMRANHRYLERCAREGRVFESALRLELASEVLAPVLEEWSTFRDRFQDRAEVSNQLSEHLQQVLERLDKMAPKDTLAKDDYLESLAWALDLRGRELDVFIEQRKSYNHRKIHPLYAKLAGPASQVIEALKSAEREELIEYLEDPQRVPFPESLDLRIRQSARSAVNLARMTDEQGHRAVNDWSRKVRSALEELARDSTPMERIPLIEFALTAGPDAAVNRDDFSSYALSTFLGVDVESTKGKLNMAFLRTVPEHEVPVSLAYLISQMGEDKASIKNLFEVGQTVGVKFGQLSAIFDLFGEEITKQIDGLRDRARPMTKCEIEKVMEAELDEDEKKLIKRPVRILGSASLKTVVEVELVDGRRVAMMVRRPSAAAQIEANLKLAEAFHKEVEKLDLPLPAALLDCLIQSLKEELAEEMQLDRDVRLQEEAGPEFDWLNQRAGGSEGPLGGWKFRVPQAIPGFKPRSSIAFVDLAKGVPLDALPKQVQDDLGPELVDALLDLFFERGAFDADRHRGNFFVDPATKEIFIIDVGQFRRFERKKDEEDDDLLTLSRFFQAVHEKRIGLLVEFAEKMVRPGTSLDRGRARTALRRVFGRPDDSRGMSGRVLDVVSELSAAGMRWERKFFFGALKGLLVLGRERYVSQDQFEDKLRARVTDRIMSHPSSVKREWPRALWRRFFRLWPASPQPLHRRRAERADESR
jgi:predicted unusual protein kinase regulating ubiquinone biosynthesis (AarF/ABC1/UbiB family)